MLRRLGASLAAFGNRGVNGSSDDSDFSRGAGFSKLGLDVSTDRLGSGGIGAGSSTEGFESTPIGPLGCSILGAENGSDFLTGICGGAENGVFEGAVDGRGLRLDDLSLIFPMACLSIGAFGCMGNAGGDCRTG
jgi:hypothetical protein